MKYKIVYQFRWLLILVILTLIYLSNLILIKLPFISISFPHNVHFEFQLYNLQTIVVWTCGIICGPRVGFITLCIYLLLGFIGFPVFAGGGGLDYYKEPTFGYLISLPLNAFLSGWLYEKNKSLLSVFVPIFTTHLLGIIYLLLFKQSWLDVTWYLSFSMISYDLIFAFLLMPILPFVSFFLKEMFIQEMPTRNSLIGLSGRKL